MASSISQRERFTILLASMKGLSMKPNSLCAASALAAGAEVPTEDFANVGGPSGWAQVNGSEPARSGRFQGMNHVGLDTVRVRTAVPEPSACAMPGMGPGLLGLLRRTSRT